MSDKAMHIVKLVKPGEASSDVEQVFQEICRMKDPRWLGPLFGFFANVPPLPVTTSGSSSSVGTYHGLSFCC